MEMRIEMKMKMKRKCLQKIRIRRGGGGVIVLPRADLGSDSSSPVLSPFLSDNTQCSAFNPQQRNKQVLDS
jgi:hypothetical protein